MKMLLATDGSEFSRLALEKAAEIGSATGSEVIVLAVSQLVNLGTVGPMVYAPESAFEVPTKEESEGILQEAGEYLTARGITHRTMRCIGQPAEAILHTAEEEHVDLIVMGSHGRTGLQRFLLGSVSNQVVSHSPVSVLVARAPKQAKPSSGLHEPTVQKAVKL
ncbi:MAG TPA: universal stress protein [Stenomitos sp.]